MPHSSNSTSENLEVREARNRPRFNLSKPLDATVANQQATICNLSAEGLGITHPAPVRIGSTVLIRVSAPENDADVAFRGRLAWSRLSRIADSNGKYPYASGISVSDDSPAVVGLFGRLIRAHGTREAGSLDAKREALEHRAKSRRAPMTLAAPVHVAPRISNDQALMIQQARNVLANNPDAAKKWYDRAKYSLVNRGIIASADRSAPYRREVIVVWEYLEGKIELDLVASVLDSMSAQRT